MAGLKELAKPEVASEYGIAEALPKYWGVMAPAGREPEEVLVAVVEGVGMPPEMPAPIRTEIRPPAATQDDGSPQGLLSPETVLDAIMTRQGEMGPIIAEQMKVSAEQLRQVEEKLQVATLRVSCLISSQPPPL